jgi:TonB-linked SusC/RagA family outer membrane protein
MRVNHKINRSIRTIFVVLLGIIITAGLSGQGRTEKAQKTISVGLKVVDESGTAIGGAKVVIGEGLIHAVTDASGAYTVTAYPAEIITVTAPGYEKSVVLVQDLVKDNTVKLGKAKLLMTSDDDVPLPYMTQKKRFMTGSTNVIRSSQLEKYPSIDLRNGFTGIPGLVVTERDGSTGISAEEALGNYDITEKVAVTTRGRALTYIIDDMPVDITEMTLDPQEIESVTLIKDIVGKAMYGPIGAGGILYIKTKRGRANERVLNVNTEYGMSVIDRFPEWASGAEYARLNNQARSNDLLPPNYDEAAITAYGKNDPYDMYHPSIDFREMMLKNTKSFQRVSVSSGGGSDMIQYSSYLGYSGEGDIYKIGSTADYNRINARSNIDIRITDHLDIDFDIAAGLSIRRSPNYGYTSTTGEGGSQMNINEISDVLPDITSIPPVAFPVYAKNDPALKAPWYGVSSVYKFNPVANITRNGSYYETGRKASAKLVLNYDLSGLIPGLKSHTGLGFDALNLIRIGKSKDYIAYIVTPSVSVKTGNDTILLTKSHDGVDNPSLLNLHDYYYLRLAFFESLSYQKRFGNSDLQSTLTYFLYRKSINGIEEPQREQLGVWTGKYTYNDKYTFQVVLNYAGTYSFAEEQRAKLFPSAGAGWIISDESFMSNVKFINFLKLRAEAGILGFENWVSPQYNLDNFSSSTGSNFGPYSTGRWFGTTNETSPYIAYPNRIGNPDLTWEKRKEFSIGIDALMFNNKLSLEVNYFNNLRDGQIVQLSNSMPYISGYSGALPRFNYNKSRVSGPEVAIQFTDRAGQLGYSFGGYAFIRNSKIIKYDEGQYRFDYQFVTGLTDDTYWGLTCLGKFSSDAEALVVPQLFDVVLKKGDLKYKDMNSDGVVDDNDQSSVGHTTPRLIYSLNAQISWKNLEMTIVGDGRAFFDIPLTNAYYWNGWGDNNYSKFVKDNIGGAYPRLTYYKVNNNFVNSDFWLTKGDYFKIQNVELAYTIPSSKLQLIRSQGMRIFLRGANLLTLSPVKDVDPESINSGVTLYPLYRTFTGGIKLTF